MTPQTAAVLDALGSGAYGYEVIRATGLPSGTVYPILRRLEASGVLDGRWEACDPVAEGRPRRRFYTPTNGGPT